MIPFRLIPYGFEWGPVAVTRLVEYRGTVVIGVQGAPGAPLVEIRVSPRGHSVRVYYGGKEITP